MSGGVVRYDFDYDIGPCLCGGNRFDDRKNISNLEHKSTILQRSPPKLVAFHDRSTKIFPNITPPHFLFHRNFAYGFFCAQRRFWHRQTPKVNSSSDVPLDNFARPRCRAIFEGFYQQPTEYNVLKSMPT